MNRFFLIDDLWADDECTPQELAVAFSLAQLVNFKTAANKKLWFASVTTNIKALSERARVHRNTVKKILERMQSRDRIFLNTEPQRGVNKVKILIGLKSGILFAPVLTREKLGVQTAKNIQEATDQETVNRYKKQGKRLLETKPKRDNDQI